LLAYYYWSPKWTGVMYNETRGKIHFWWTLISFNVTFFPMHFLGLAGMPRRYADYPMQFADFNALASVGAFAFGIAQVYFFFFVVLPTMRGKGEPAPQRPWEAAEGLEWEVPSPAPFHTFETPAQAEPVTLPASWLDRLSMSAFGMTTPEQKKSNLRLGLILASVAAVFFLGYRCQNHFS
jgi:heme/copper-type cytochrome/quinol oxidase subunit 1